MICFFIAVPLALALSIAWLPVGVVAAVVASVKVDGRRESDEVRGVTWLVFHSHFGSDRSISHEGQNGNHRGE